MDDKDDCFMQQNSQPFFIEDRDEFESYENNKGKGNNSKGRRSTKHCYDEINDISQSLQLPQVPHNYLYKRKRLQKIIDQDIQEEDSKDNNKNIKKKLQHEYELNNQDLFEKHNKDDQKYSSNDIPLTQKSNSEESEVKCIHCTFNKELDKRNYFFGNLLIGELQYLRPCMRSEAYIKILNYVNKLKQKHIQEPLD